MEKLKIILTEIVVIVVILFIICVAALVDLKSKDSVSTSKVIRDMYYSLQQEKKVIDDLGDDIKKGSKELKNLKDNMDNIKSSGGYGWNDAVIKYNSKLNEYNTKMNEYSEKVKTYNKRYEQYEKMKQKNENIIQWVKTVIGID
ncbi:hypothetical protein ACJDU8_14060 [Clostridium sp. WILCCON 0269]|uniref:Uncharacterized protein n=1 Tax=Candidatus Clostridium eludens TaxID=3381663 RepID=A0ABW8SNC7_9CLOT